MTHKRQLSLTEGESDFLPLPVFFFEVSSAIADITRVMAIRASCSYISCIEPCRLKLMKLVLEVHSKVEHLLFSTGSSNSGTILHGGDGGGKDLFSPCEVSKTSEIPYRAKCTT